VRTAVLGLTLRTRKVSSESLSRSGSANSTHSSGPIIGAKWCTSWWWRKTVSRGISHSRPGILGMGTQMRTCAASTRYSSWVVSLPRVVMMGKMCSDSS
jgi:hypothetical protein